VNFALPSIAYALWTPLSGVVEWVVIGVGSALAGLAPTLILLVAARGLHGLGAA
jgi:hypothetical protein